jgi:hypothetical protein
MKRMLMIAAALASLAFVAAPSPSQAATSVGFSVRIGDPYRGAAIRFRSEPDYVVVPGTRIYYMEDYYGRDIYRYGGWFYMVDEDGFWYRARSLRGPFFAIDVDILPDVFYDVPAGYYHYWSPERLDGYYRTGNRIYYRGGDYGNYRTRDRYNGGDRYYGGGDRNYSRDRTYSRDRGYQGGTYPNRTYRTRDNWDWNRAQENRVQRNNPPPPPQDNRVQQNNPPPQDNRGDRGNRGNWRGRGRGQDNRDQGNNGNGNDNGNGRGNGRGRGHDNGND